MPQRRSIERFEENVAALRALIDAGSPCVVRGRLERGAVPGGPLKYPVPSIGDRSGKLTVTGYIMGARNGVKALIVQCDCGRPEFTVERHNFKAFKSTRCSPCGHDAGGKKRYWQYADALPNDGHRTRLLNRLSSAITRCHNPKCKVYHHYGGRGIYVHQEWRDDRSAFLRYVQTLPGWDNPAFEMDRADNSKGYLPGNIRFVSPSANARNKRKISELEARIRELEARVSGF